MTYAQLSICPVIVGRDRDLARGMEVLHTATAGRGGLLFISGEAGMGKSRMLRELSARADGLGFRVLVGVCQEHDRAFPFAPFLDAVRQFVHSAPAEAVDRLLGADRPTLARLLPELGVGGPPAVPLPPEQEKRCLFEAFVGLLTRFARDGGPLLLALEDVHWADETTLELLQLLPRRLAQVSVAIVLTARSDELESALGHWLAYLERNRLIDRLDLAPLTAPQTVRLIEATI